MKLSTTLNVVLAVGLLGLSFASSRATEAAAEQNLSTGQSPEQRGLEIARKVRAARLGFAGETSDMEMILINASGDQIKRRMTLRLIEVTDDGDRSLITFRWPADVRDTRLLTWIHRHSADDQWLYLPSIKRIRRISSTSRSGSFMGSEFAYEDMTSKEVEKYTYRYLRDESLDGRQTWVIARYPVERGSGYSKQIVWYDKEYMNPLRTEFYDRKGDLLKTATFDDYRLFGRWWRAARVRMENVQTGKTSIIIWSERQVGEAPDAREFFKEGLTD